MERQQELGEIIREPEPPHLPSVVGVAPGLVMAFLSDGFLLINAARASRRILHEAFIGGYPQTQSPIFPLRVKCPDKLAQRLDLMARLGFALAVSGGFAVVSSLPLVPWQINPESLEHAFAELVDIPPMDLPGATAVLVQHLSLTPDKPLSPRAAAQLADALFSCKEPLVGPDGGVTAVRFKWSELSQGII